jgi:16S rRNA (guanine527-N7)-methyltransferase
MELIRKYFGDLNSAQLEMFVKLMPLYQHWNSKINVISRKDIDNFYVNHVLHSLSIGKIINFLPGTTVLDVGTGGGFPGIPLAILFNETQFTLIDSIGKKIKVVNEITEELGIRNVTAKQERAENIKTKFDFIVSRAVTQLPIFNNWIKNSIASKSNNKLPNGILYLKGGDFTDELMQLTKRHKIYPIKDYFNEPFFETKKVVHIFS